MGVHAEGHNLKNIFVVSENTVTETVMLKFRLTTLFMFSQPYFLGHHLYFILTICL